MALVVLDIDGLLHGLRPGDAAPALVRAALDGAGDAVLLSGRPERCRPGTEAWLAERGLGGYPLVLRPDGDRSGARAFKCAALASLGGPGAVEAVISDDARIASALADAGYDARVLGS